MAPSCRGGAALPALLLCLLAAQQKQNDATVLAFNPLAHLGRLPAGSSARLHLQRPQSSEGSGSRSSGSSASQPHSQRKQTQSGRKSSTVRRSTADRSTTTRLSDLTQSSSSPSSGTTRIGPGTTQALGGAVGSITAVASGTRRIGASGGAATTGTGTGVGTTTAIRGTTQPLSTSTSSSLGGGSTQTLSSAASAAVTPPQSAPVRSRTSPPQPSDGQQQRSHTISLGLSGTGLPFFATNDASPLAATNKAVKPDNIPKTWPPLSPVAASSEGRRSTTSALEMVPISNNDKVARAKTWSLTSPPAKRDRRAPTRAINPQPEANKRATMVLGGDKKTNKNTSIQESKAATTPTTPLSDQGSANQRSSGPSFGEFQLPFSQASYEISNGMTNDGPFAWMVPYVKLIGYQPGKTLMGAIPQNGADSATANLSEAEKTARRTQADEELTNISPEERERRAGLAGIMLKVAGGYAALSAVILDDGSIGGHLTRLAVLPFLFLWRGYDLSAKSGL